MKRLKRVTIAIITVTLTLALRINADEWDKATSVTFSEPIEIPGQILPAGTYTLKLLESPSSRNLVQIFNANQTKLYATILTIPDYHLKPAAKTILTFEERPADSPEALQAWFYPGDNYGQQFVYPKDRAVQLAKVNRRPVPSMPADFIVNTQQPAAAPTATHMVALKQAPVIAQQANGEEMALAEVFVTPPFLMAQAMPPKLPAPTTLPKTASPWASIALSGVLLWSLAALLHIAKKKVA